MSKSPRTFSKFFKFTAVLESYIEGNVSACASRHGVHVTQLNVWRKIFRLKGPDIFENPKVKVSQEKSQISQLEQIIGRLTIENQLLKKVHGMLT